MQAAKKIKLDFLISELEDQYSEIKKTNEEGIKKLENDFHNEKNTIFEDIKENPNNILNDLEVVKKEEEDFLNYLENKQQDLFFFEDENQKETELNLDTIDFPAKTRKILKDDIVCQVCNDGDYSEDNLIVFCAVIYI